MEKHTEEKMGNNIQGEESIKGRGKQSGIKQMVCTTKF